MKQIKPQNLIPGLTPWHITFGTYGTRLHGDGRPTVDKKHNEIGASFVEDNADRPRSERERMKFPPRYLTIEQRRFAEVEITSICQRGGWSYRICAAAPDHIHVLCDAVPEVHGEKVRRLLKRWLGQELSKRWPLARGATWWAEEGSNIAVKDESYLNNVYRYILRQRTTCQLVGGEDAPAR